MNAGQLYFGTDPRERELGAPTPKITSLSDLRRLVVDTQRQARGRNSLTLFDV